jgi:hypothetical protein
VSATPIGLRWAQLGTDGYEALIDLPGRVQVPVGTHRQPRTVTY